jgi:hypothetical protein
MWAGAIVAGALGLGALYCYATRRHGAGICLLFALAAALAFAGASLIMAAGR